ncbi:hypothetical protein [Spirosoma lituiforme]
MSTTYAVPSLRNAFLTLLILGSLTTACKKSGGADAVDPRDQYVGTYVGDSRRTIYVVADILQGPIPGVATTTITKGSNSKELYIETTVANNGGFTGGYTLRVTAEVDESTFTVIDKSTDQIELPSGKIDSDYTATGAFDTSKKQFVYSATARALRNGAQYSRTDEITSTLK